MKLKSLLSVICFSLISQVFAANVHINPQADSRDKESIQKNGPYPSQCHIEIVNDTLTNVSVFGTFDDNSRIKFDFYWYDTPHYISLFYNYSCHRDMYLTVQTQAFPYTTLYSNYTPVNSTVHVFFYGKGQGNPGKDDAKSTMEVEVLRK